MVQQKGNYLVKRKGKKVKGGVSPGNPRHSLYRGEQGTTKSEQGTTKSERKGYDEERTGYDGSERGTMKERAGYDEKSSPKGACWITLLQNHNQ